MEWGRNKENGDHEKDTTEVAAAMLELFGGMRVFGKGKATYDDTWDWNAMGEWNLIMKTALGWIMK